MVKKDEENEFVFYPILEKFLEGVGYPLLFIITRKFALGPPKDILPDLFAFRCIGNELETVAIECKFNKDGAERSVYDGLRQASRYTEFCHKVYVATQEGDIKHSRVALEKLGLGHISVNASKETYEITLPASRNSPPKFCSDLKSRLIPLVIFKEIVEEGELNKVGIKGDELEIRNVNERGFIKTPDDPHFSVFSYDNETICIQINIAIKDSIRAFYEINIDRLLSLLQHLNRNVKISVWERGEVQGHPRKTKYPEEYILEEKEAYKITKKDIEEIIEKIKKIDDWGYIRFFIELSYSEGMPKERLIEDMRGAIKVLLPLYDFLVGR